MEIKAKLVVSLINANISVLMSAVLFMSATSITRSSEGALPWHTLVSNVTRLYCLKRNHWHWHVLINYYEGTCWAGSKNGASWHLFIMLTWQLPLWSFSGNQYGNEDSVWLYLLLMHHFGSLRLICIKSQAVIRGFEVKLIFESIHSFKINAGSFPSCGQ